MEQQSTVAESVSGGGRRSVETSRRKVNNTEAMDQQFEQSTFAESAASNPATQAAAAEEEEPKENVLLVPDEITDVILEVEGKELHTNRAVLAHYSPVFRAMFYSTLREKACNKVPLPGKRYDSMVTFCNVLYPRSASAKYLIDDDNLIPLLMLAEEYQADTVKTECQAYIINQLCGYFLHYYQHAIFSSLETASERDSIGLYDLNLHPLQAGETEGQKVSHNTLIHKLVLYLWACDAYRLPTHRYIVKSLVVDVANCLNDVTRSGHYSSLPLTTKVDLLEAMCRKFDGSQEVA